MVGFTIIAGALISLGIGWLGSEYIFGKTSNAGYHGPSGRLKTKGKGTELRLMKIVVTGAVALLLSGSVAATVIQAFVGAFSGALDSLQTGVHPHTADTLLIFAGSVPGLATFSGWIIAIVGGGPLGLVG